MSLESWDPYRRLDEFRQRTNQVLDELLAELSTVDPIEQPIGFQPEVDLVETPNEYRFYLSVPGLVEDDILIDIDGRCLTIRGERKPPYDLERRGPHLREWRYGFFERHFDLPTVITVSSIRAIYDAGVLTIVARKNQNDDVG